MRPRFVVGQGFRWGLSTVLASSLLCLGHRSRLATAEDLGRCRFRLDGDSGADELQPLDDHLLAGLDARFEHAEAFVDEGRLDHGDRHLALTVDGVDGWTSLALDHRLLGDDHRVLGLTDLDVSLHILTGQDDPLRVGDLRLDPERRSRRVDRVVDDGRLAGEAAGLLALESGSVDLDGEPLSDQLRHPVEVPGRNLHVDPHGVELPDDRELGVIRASAARRRPHEVAEFHFSQADPAVDRRGESAIAQVDLGVHDPGLGPVDVRLGSEDEGVVVSLGLFQAGLVGIDLGRVFLA